MEESAVILLVNWVFALLFILIGIFSWRKETPMHFWSGSTVTTEEISDVKAYNKANGLMWISYGSIFIIAGIIGLFKLYLFSIIILLTASLPGILILIIIYRRIYHKYKK